MAKKLASYASNALTIALLIPAVMVVSPFFAVMDAIDTANGVELDY